MMRHALKRGSVPAVILEYTDGNGERSTRGVAPLAILIGDGKRSPASTYLQARCSVQRAVRSFRFDRISAVSDAETGENWPIEAWTANLPLGPGKSIVAFDEVDDEPAVEIAPVPTVTSRTAWVFWRSIMLAVIVGYAIGRLRILHFFIRATRVRHGLWL